jgi:nucleoside-diphosphate-sugar epimerase
MAVTMVTGGTGFIGRYVVNALADAGDRVVSYNRDYVEAPRPEVTPVQGELFDIPRLVRTLEGYGVERIVHTAAMSHPELSIDLPLTTFAANVDGTLKLFEAARLANVARIVNFSSECAYGHQEGVVREDARLRPTTPYGVTKVTTELMAEVYTDLYGMAIVSLRVTEVYGPGNRMPEVLKEMIQAGLSGEHFRLEAGADHRFQFVHADDVTQAVLAAASLNGSHQPAYNVTGGSQVTLAEAAELVRALLPDARLDIGPGHFPNFDRQGPFDLEASRRDLGYEPRWRLEQGIADYAEWLRGHPY